MGSIRKREDGFDFDSWVALAKLDQESFEASRKERIQETLERAILRGGNRRRLQGLQCRIDMERRRARTPLKACIRLSSMMWDSVVELREKLALYSLVEVSPSADVFSTATTDKERTPAKVICFTNRKRI